MEKFFIVRDVLKKVRRFNLSGRTLEFKIRPVPKDVEPLGWIKSAIQSIIQKGTDGLKPTDKVGFTFCSKDFARGDGFIPFKRAGDITFNDIWDMISGVYQSNSTGFNTDTFCLGITIVKMPEGRGRGRNYNSFDEECAMRKGIVSINNTDNLCLPRSLVTALAYINKDPLYKKIQKNTGKLQTLLTQELLSDAACVIPEEGAGIPELETFQRYLKDYNIVVYKYGSKGREILYEGCNEGRSLDLLYHEGHYNVITSLTAAFCCTYFCEKCRVPYEHKEQHRCCEACRSCQKSPPCSKEERKIKCAECNRLFYGEKCYENHKEVGSYANSVLCKEVRACDNCFKTIKGNREHTCDEIFCKICKTHVSAPHYCYMPVDTGKPTMKDHLFIFYDLESRQEDELVDGSLVHVPNLCVFLQCCENCIDTQTDVCLVCGVRKQILKIDPVSRFVEFVMNQRKLFKRVIVIGHAGGIYDTQFILNYILLNTDLKPELITRGTKLLSMTIGNVKFIDSLNYFPMALAKLPKVFGLDGVKKGYFPHLFNKIDNENYVGPLPSLQYYDLDNLNDSEREPIIKWHAELSERNFVFNFQKELVDYCVADVDILARACLKFRQIMIKEGNVDPFTEAITLPGACNKIFRRNFLKPKTIGLIPKNGYRWSNNQSKIAIQWLLWEEHQRQINIVHAAKQPEFNICGIKVDGFSPDTRQVFEFHGCFYHGCPKCIKYRRNDLVYDDHSDTYESRYEATLAKTNKLRNLGYEVIEKWECEFRKELTPEIKSYVEKHPLLVLSPLSPRDAFYGGRTESAKLYCKAGLDEKIKYVDVTSLYPFINKYGKYPIGHPEVYVGDECVNLNLNETEGLVKCKILPPDDLYHPVLPVKMNNKLMFPLCHSCCENMDEECTHTENERALVGTWVVDEIRKAVEKGYKLIEVYEVWKYKIEQYNSDSKSGGLFAEYISTFLKIKQQASGWPVGCDSIDQKELYIKEYYEKEGVQLFFDEIDTNPGLRQVGKSVITSFWGKLGQRENQTKTSIVKDPAEFFDIISKPFIEVNSIYPINENTLIVSWIFKDDVYEPLPTVNVVLAAYTTAQARLKLYSYLEKLEKRVLYYDTDSIIYISKPGEYEVPLGNLLGEMTNELLEYGNDSFITEFVSGGPKLYAYRVYSPVKDEYHDIIKVKGITINHKSSKLVNFAKLRGMILDEESPEYVVTKNILRTRSHEVITKETTKIFRVNFKKRVRTGEYDSVPFGYKKLKLASNS